MNQQKEIDLMEFLFFVLRKWRVLLVAALVFAVLIGGYKGFTAFREAFAGVSVSETQQAEIEKCEAELSKIQNDLDSEYAYRENSVWFNLDSNNVAGYKKVFYVSTNKNMSDEEKNLYLNSVMNSYKSLLTGEKVVSEISKNEKIAPQYVREIFSVSVGDGEGETGTIFTVSVYHRSAKDAERVMDIVIGQMGDVSKEVCDTVGKHSIEELESDTYKYVSSTLQNTKLSHDTRLNSLKTNLETKQKEFDQLSANYSAPKTGSAIVKITVKYGVFGCFFGIILLVLNYMIVFLVSDKLNRADVVKRYFDLVLLGNLNNEETKKNNRFDNFLNQLEKRGSAVDDEMEMAIIAENIRNYSDGQNVLLVTGMEEAETLKSFSEKLQQLLPEKQLLCGSYVKTDVETVKMLPKCDAVILVEKCQCSTMKGIEAELDSVRSLKKKVIGCIVSE